MRPDPSKPLAPHLRPAVSEQELSAGWSEIQASRRAKAQRRAIARGGAIALAAAGLVVAAAWFWPRPNGELLQGDGAAFHRVAAGATVRLADDSKIVTTAGGSIEVLQNSRSNLALHLLGGAARFEVTPGTGRHWSVEAGELSVEVTGTIFTVERGAERSRVAVERGAVIVRGARVPDGVRRLVAGEELTVGAPAPRAPAETPPAVEPEAEQVVAPPSPAAPSRAPAVQTAASVMATADELRREGRTAEAVSLLSSVTERWPSSPEAPLAALTAANLLQDSGDASGARRWYQRALELGLSGPLAETARQALGAGAPR